MGNRKSSPLPHTKRVEELQPVEIIWNDAWLQSDDEVELATQDGEDGSQDFGSIISCTDIGYLVRFNAREIILALSYSALDNMLRHSTAIPLAMVTKIHFLRDDSWVSSGKKSLYQTLRTKIFDLEREKTTSHRNSSPGCA